MGIVLTVIVIVTLLAVAQRVLRAYESEVSKNPDSAGAGDPFEPTLFEPGGAGSTLTSGSHSVDRNNSGCGDPPHIGGDHGVHGGCDASHGGHH